MPEPQRIQLSRRKGFNLQAASMALNGLPAVKVDRTTKWGNPFIVGTDGTRQECVDLFALLLNGYMCLTVKGDLDVRMPEQERYNAMAGRDREELRGKNLACWCPAGAPCHADILLALAKERRRRCAECGELRVVARGGKSKGRCWPCRHPDGKWSVTQEAKP